MFYRSSLRTCYVSLLLMLCGLLVAVGGARAEDGFLDPAVAFRFSSTEEAGAVVLQYRIADGYYMYRERFAFVVKPGAATLGAPQMPPGIVKFDATFNKNVETYRGQLTIRVPVSGAARPFDMTVTSQGCSDKGVCYPPAQHVIHVSGEALKPENHSSIAGTALSSASSFVGAAAADSVVPLALASVASAPDTDVPTGVDRFYSQQYAQSVLQGQSMLRAVGIFFLLGIALSLLPCSLPMIPIVSSIVLGEGRALTRWRGFFLSLAYVVGMALVYTAFGVAAALAGRSLGATLQNPWMLGAFALLLAVFALSQLGFFELQMPQAWQNSVDGVARRRSGGKYAAVFVMGALSALVVGACMTAPLFGVLAFIAQTGDVVFGGSALFAMALGIGVPLLVVGVGAGALLPRAGAWMNGVKRAFGMLLLAAALWIAAPVLPAPALLLLAALWLLLGAIGLRAFDALPQGGEDESPRRALRMLGKAIGAGFAVWAALLLVGAAAGGRDPLSPLAPFATARTSGAPLAVAAADQAAVPPFSAVRSVSEVEHAVAAAGRPSMLFFEADWCASCKEMQKFTFTDPQVRDRLASMNLLAADVTANNEDDQALMKQYGLFGPPAAIFFDADGKELAAMRVVGYQPSATFVRSLERAGSAFTAAGAGS